MGKAAGVLCVGTSLPQGKRVQGAFGDHLGFILSPFLLIIVDFIPSLVFILETSKSGERRVQDLK